MVAVRVDDMVVVAMIPTFFSFLFFFKFFFFIIVFKFLL
jgi:hypothetical protein